MNGIHYGENIQNLLKIGNLFLSKSKMPAETITIGPITAKIDTRETRVVDFKNKEFEKI